MKREFKKGDKVYCEQFGYGKIISIDNEKLAYTLKVKFKKIDTIIRYTNDGYYYSIVLGCGIIKDKELDIHHVPPTWWQQILNKLKS